MTIAISNAGLSNVNSRRLGTDATPGQPVAQPAVLRTGDRFEVTRVQAGQPSAAEREVAGKINTLVQNRFGGDWSRAFEAYANGGQVNRDGVLRMLGDAGVGGLLMPRGIVADRLMDKFDVNRSGTIGFGEFRTGMNNLGFRV